MHWQHLTTHARQSIIDTPEIQGVQVSLNEPWLENLFTQLLHQWHHPEDADASFSVFASSGDQFTDSERRLLDFDHNGLSIDASANVWLPRFAIAALVSLKAARIANPPALRVGMV
jgi:hypothetical protein